MKILRCLIIAILMIVAFGGRAEAQEQSSFLDENGRYWHTFSVNDVDVYLNLSKVKKMGRYVMLSVKIVNRSDADVPFDFSNTTLECNGRKVKFYGRNEFENRLERRRRWNRFGAEMVSFATAVTLNAAIGQTHWGRYHYSFGNEVLRGLAIGAIYSGTMAGTILVDDIQAAKIAAIVNEDVAYLDNCLIKPNHAINGFAYARYTPRLDMITVYLPIGGRVFGFNVNPLSISELN